MMLRPATMLNLTTCSRKEGAAGCVHGLLKHQPTGRHANPRPRPAARPRGPQPSRLGGLGALAVRGEVDVADAVLHLLRGCMGRRGEGMGGTNSRPAQSPPRPPALPPRRPSGGATVPRARLLERDEVALVPRRQLVVRRHGVGEDAEAINHVVPEERLERLGVGRELLHLAVGERRADGLGRQANGSGRWKAVARGAPVRRGRRGRARQTAGVGGGGWERRRLLGSQRGRAAYWAATCRRPLSMLAPQQPAHLSGGHKQRHVGGGVLYHLLQLRVRRQQVVEGLWVEWNRGRGREGNIWGARGGTPWRGVSADVGGGRASRARTTPCGRTLVTRRKVRAFSRFVKTSSGSSTASMPWIVTPPALMLGLTTLAEFWGRAGAGRGWSHTTWQQG
jgi:hypothetical protein